MTEVEWLTETEPIPMLEFIREKASERKLRLFCVACCRRTKDLLTEIGKQAVDCVEQYAEGKTDETALASAENLGWWHADSLAWAGEEEAIQAAHDATYFSVVGNYPGAIRAAAEALGIVTEAPIQCQYLRDIVGNPFRPVVLDLPWLSSTVVSLARQVYESREFATMPILADALQDAGCENIEILNHCRGEGPHVLGCWVIDLLLGKA